MNTVFAVICSIGLEHGHEVLVGLCTKEEWAIEIKDEFKRKRPELIGAHYYIEEIPLNEEVNLDIASW